VSSALPNACARRGAISTVIASTTKKRTPRPVTTAASAALPRGSPAAKRASAPTGGAGTGASDAAKRAASIGGAKSGVGRRTLASSATGTVIATGVGMRRAAASASACATIDGASCTVDEIEGRTS